MWGRAMRAGIVAWCVGSALLVAGCSPNDRAYIRDGIGTQLYTADTASAAELQNIYLDYLCREANSYVGTEVPGCAQQFVPANDWPIIVQAGLNDIDARCDSYLAWLDLKRREKTAILAEIVAVRTAVDALTNPNIAGVSGVGLAAISAAFGLATNTVNSLNSLLLQVDQTTVQNVVVNNRRVFREDVRKFSSSINNKPAAVHTLRTYLNICMPMTIAAKINSTVTVLQETGTAIGAGPIIPTIGVPFTPQDPFKPRPIPPKEPDIVLGAETVISGYPGNVRTYTPEVIGSILVGLCAPETELTQITEITKAYLNIWERTDTQNSKRDDKITNDRERKAIVGTSCPEGILNVFERGTFKSPKDVELLVTLLNQVPLNGPPPANAPLPANATLEGTRKRVELVRKDCFIGKLTKLPDSMKMQVTPDLFSELGKYKRAREAAEKQTPPAEIPRC
jgi:hypothetical protein